MAIQKAECFVLRRIPFRETSWIVTFLTRSFGKIRGIVKGARKIKSPLLGAFEILTHSEIVFYEKTRSNLHLVTDASILDSNEELRRQFSVVVYANYFCELLDSLFVDRDPHPESFELLSSAVQFLKSEVPRQALLRAFEVQLLDQIGLLPRLWDCLKCGTSSFQKTYFHPLHGGIFCERCYAGNPGGFLVGPVTLESIRSFLEEDIKVAATMELDARVSREMEQVMTQFIERRIDKPLKSIKFLSQVKEKVFAR